MVFLYACWCLTRKKAPWFLVTSNQILDDKCLCFLVLRQMWQNYSGRFWRDTCHIGFKPTSHHQNLTLWTLSNWNWSRAAIILSSQGPSVNLQQCFVLYVCVCDCVCACEPHGALSQLKTRKMITGGGVSCLAPTTDDSGCMAGTLSWAVCPAAFVGTVKTRSHSSVLSLCSAPLQHPPAPSPHSHLPSPVPPPISLPRASFPFLSHANWSLNRATAQPTFVA